MDDLEPIMKLAPLALLLLLGLVKRLVQARRERVDTPQSASPEDYDPSWSKSDEIDFERDYEPLEPR